MNSSDKISEVAFIAYAANQAKWDKHFDSLSPAAIDRHKDLAEVYVAATHATGAGSLSCVARSNLITMAATAKVEPRQEVPGRRCMPCGDVRELRARLLVEECFETLAALGVGLRFRNDSKHLPAISASDFRFDPDNLTPDLREAVDGCCDLIYVAVGTLCAMGVPDLPHLDEVCRCNEAKFPGGEARVDWSGKLQKPDGWVGPTNALDVEFDMAAAQREIVECDAAT